MLLVVDMTMELIDCGTRNGKKDGEEMKSAGVADGRGDAEKQGNLLYMFRGL